MLVERGLPHLWSKSWLHRIISIDDLGLPSLLLPPYSLKVRSNKDTLPKIQFPGQWPFQKQGQFWRVFDFDFFLHPLLLLLMISCATFSKFSFHSTRWFSDCIPCYLSADPSYGLDPETLHQKSRYTLIPHTLIIKGNLCKIKCTSRI